MPKPAGARGRLEQRPLQRRPASCLRETLGRNRRTESTQMHRDAGVTGTTDSPSPRVGGSTRPRTNSPPQADLGLHHPFRCFQRIVSVVGGSTRQRFLSLIVGHSFTDPGLSLHLFDYFCE